jgi:hypothetical protein
VPLLGDTHTGSQRALTLSLADALTDPGSKRRHRHRRSHDPEKSVVKNGFKTTKFLRLHRPLKNGGAQKPQSTTLYDFYPCHWSHELAVKALPTPWVCLS